ncbi:MAG: flagellar assembly protein FliW [Solirubrobacteraceae bacterium]
MITIESTRFGTVEIAPESVVEFPDGLIGLGGRRYALLATDAGSPFLWLHSLEDPKIALPVTNPHRFFSDFSVELNDEDAARLEFDDAASVDVYVTVRAAPALEDFTANLKAPILIRAGRAHQVINQAKGVSLRAQLFKAEATESEQAC